MTIAKAKTRMSAEDRKKAIVDAAIPIFAKFGFKCTTTKEIAGQAGISEALLYKHFSSKDDLFEVIQSEFCRGSQRVASLIADGENKSVQLIIATLAKAIIEGFDGDDEHELVSRLVMNSLLDDGEFNESFIKSHFQVWMPQLTEAFEEAVAQGKFIESVKFEESLIWLAHHFFAGVAFYKLPNKFYSTLGYKRDEYLKKVILFALRGIGLKEEVIQKEFEYDQIMSLLNGGLK